MGARVGRRGALACVVLALALAGCGGSDDDEDGRGGADASGGAAATGDGSGDGGLGTERFKRVEALFDGGVTLEDYAGPVDGLRRACERLDEDEPLQAALRRRCAVSLKLSRRLKAANECGIAPRCKALKEMAETARQQVEVSRATNEAIDGASLSDDCADALKSQPGDVAYLEATAESFELLDKARRTNSAEDAERSTEVLTKAAEDTTTGQEQLERFRRGCG